MKLTILYVLSMKISDKRTNWISEKVKMHWSEPKFRPYDALFHIKLP